MAEKLPEGTDHIVPGSESAKAARVDDVVKAGSDAAKAEVVDLKEQAKAKAEDFKTHALEQVRDYAQEGQSRASGALDGVAKLIGDNAAQIDEFAGTHYGDYARRASAYVSDAATNVREKDIDELLDIARDFVRQAPGAALATAVVAGFFASRVVKAGTAAPAPATKGVQPSSRPAAARRSGPAPRR